jgi:hypothetical protein
MLTNQELIKHLRQLGKYSEFEPNYFLLAADRIEELEQGVKHGCWQYDGYGGGVILGTDAPLSYKCSACGEWSVDESNYCPNCGARMDKETEVTDNG